MMLALFLVLFVGVIVALLAFSSERERRGDRAWRSQVEWAESLLPPGSYELREPDVGPPRIVLTREVVVQGVPCAPGPISFGQWGRLQGCRLARDHDVASLSLRGGTRVVFDPATGVFAEGTLRRPTIIRGIPCAAGPVRLAWTGRVLSAELSADHTIDGVPCRRGTAIHFREGVLTTRLVGFTPCVPIERWGMVCAADCPVDLEWRTATLATDRRCESFTLPAGSTFGHDIDWGHLWVKLARPLDVLGFVFPAGATVHPGHDPMHPSRARWLRQWLDASDDLLGGSHTEAWSLGGVPVAPHAWVRILARGRAVIRLEEDWLVGGLRYPAGSSVTVDVEGHILGWETGPNAAWAPAASPYR